MYRNFENLKKFTAKAKSKKIKLQKFFLKFNKVSKLFYNKGNNLVPFSERKHGQKLFQGKFC